jgi:Pao retrotransposon peptidase
MDWNETDNKKGGSHLLQCIKIAYTAVAYVLNCCNQTISLLTCKTKLASLKPVTLLRLQLLALYLGTQMSVSLYGELSRFAKVAFSCQIH